MSEIHEKYEIYCNDFHLNSTKRHKPKQQLAAYNSSSKESNHTHILEKVRELPMLRQSKDVISKFVINDAILDIIKVLKAGDNSVTIHAKANVNHKMFESLKNNENIVIKVFYREENTLKEIWAYSRNVHNEEKEPSSSAYPYRIHTDNNFLCEKLTLYQAKNILIMKMLEKPKTISQMIEKHPNNMKQMYQELLTLTVDFKDRDDRFWSSELYGAKNIVWSGGKWIFLSAYDERNSRDLMVMSINVMNIVDTFHQHGMEIGDLRRVFTNIYSCRSQTWKCVVSHKVDHEYLKPKEKSGSSPGKYVRMHYSRKTK